MYVSYIVVLFQTTFGDANSPANNRKSFVFFMKFLTDVMPFEAAHYVKVRAGWNYDAKQSFHFA